MKKICLFAILLMASLVGTAQTHVNLVAAPQFNHRIGARAGVDIDVALGKSNFSFVPGLYWSMRHSNFSALQISFGGPAKPVEVNDLSHWLTVPLRFSYTINKGDENFQAQFLVGPYLALGLAGTTTCKDHETGTVYPKADSFSKKGYYDDRFDVGLNSGINFIIKEHLVLGVFSELGFRPLSNVMRFADTFFLSGAVQNIFTLNFGGGINIGYRF